MNECAQCQAQTTDVVCGVCVRRVGRVLNDLVGLVDALEDTITKQTRGAASVGTRLVGHAKPLPFADSPNIDNAERDLGILCEWAAHVTGQASAGRDRRARAIDAIDALIGSPKWFRTDPAAPVAIDAIYTIRATVRRAVDRPAVRVFAGICGADAYALTIDTDDAGQIVPVVSTVICDAVLRAEPGQAVVQCRTCGAMHTAGEIHARKLAALEAAILPLDEILAALPEMIGHAPAPGTVRQWRNRGQLAALHGPWLEDEEPRVPLYLGGSVLRLARDQDVRTGPRRKDRTA